MRSADPGDSEDIAQIQEMFFVELGKYSEYQSWDLCLYKDVQEKLFCMLYLGHVNISSLQPLFEGSNSRSVGERSLQYNSFQTITESDGGFM